MPIRAVSTVPSAWLLTRGFPVAMEVVCCPSAPRGLLRLFFLAILPCNLPLSPSLPTNPIRLSLTLALRCCPCQPTLGDAPRTSTLSMPLLITGTLFDSALIMLLVIGSSRHSLLGTTSCVASRTRGEPSHRCGVLNLAPPRVLTGFAHHSPVSPDTDLMPFMMEVRGWSASNWVCSSRHLWPICPWSPCSPGLTRSHRSRWRISRDSSGR